MKHGTVAAVLYTKPTTTAAAKTGAPHTWSVALHATQHLTILEL